ncbi:MAG: DUF488 family protein [Bacteroidota bacterium]
MAIKVKRIYEPYTPSDGYRVLVDRLWPRGVAKAGAHLDRWMKEVAPSTALRQWFDHDESKWNEFVSRYHSELKGTSAIQELIALRDQHKNLTLLFSAKNEKYNQAVALMKMLGGK